MSSARGSRTTSRRLHVMSSTRSNKRSGPPPPTTRDLHVHSRSLTSTSVCSAANMEASRAFDEEWINLPYEELLEVGGGIYQHRLGMRGTALKLNSSRQMLPNGPTMSSGARDLLTRTQVFQCTPGIPMARGTSCARWVMTVCVQTVRPPLVRVRLRAARRRPRRNRADPGAGGPSRHGLLVVRVSPGPRAQRPEGRAIAEVWVRECGVRAWLDGQGPPVAATRSSSRMSGTTFRGDAMVLAK